MRYANANTRRYYERDLKALFGFAGVDHPRLLTESVVLAWCGQGRANNTVRNTLSRACVNGQWWCVRQGEADAALVEALMSRDNPLSQIPRLYGRVQGVRPARWLSHSEAFEQLIGSCRDGTDLGLRDEALIRLGLAGMRAAEIIHLRVGDLRPAIPLGREDEGSEHCTGRGDQNQNEGDKDGQDHPGSYMTVGVILWNQGKEGEE